MADVANKKIRVLVVDDSAFMRKVISDILNGDSEIEVIDVAKNGVEAIEKAKKLKPDVVTLDVEMPVMDGLTCLRELIKFDFIPVVMLSGITKAGADATISALEYGAIDFITKPTNIFDMSGEIKKNEIVEKVKMSKYTRKYTRKQAAVTPESMSKPAEIKKEIEKSSDIKCIVAIGTSTGGPKSLQDVIPKIPGNIPAAFLIVQHMPPGFTKSLSERLNSMSELTVKEAEAGEVIKAGYAYIAPGDYHMLVEKTGGTVRIRLSKEPPVGGHRPAVDVMMESLSNAAYKNIAAVIMTGMGGDGSEGIKLIKKNNGGYIIAQDEKSCIVYGMPKVAVQTGAVDVVVPLKEIAAEIIKYVGVYR